MANSLRSEWYNIIYHFTNTVGEAANSNSIQSIDDLEAEIRSIRRFRYKDLNTTDQLLCPVQSIAIDDFLPRVGPIVGKKVSKELQKVGKQLRDFGKRAENMYGNEACVTMMELTLKENAARRENSLG